MVERRKRLSAAARREELLDAALEVAAGGELVAVSVAEIAARAGVSEGLLYHYWPTKQALVTAAVARAAGDLLGTLEQADSAGTAAERLDAAVDAYLHHVQAQPTGWRALLAARSGEAGAIAEQVERRAHAFILQVLAVPSATAALRVALAGWSAFEREACLAWLDDPSLSADQLKELLLSTFTAALASVAAHDAVARSALARLQGPAG